MDSLDAVSLSILLGALLVLAGILSSLIALRKRGALDDSSAPAACRVSVAATLATSCPGRALRLASRP